MAFWDSLFGTEGKMGSQSTLLPQQQQFLSQLLGQINPDQFQLSGNPLYQAGGSYLQNLLSGSPEMMQQFQQPAINQFQQEILPMIADRFGRGMNARGSSGFNQALGRAGEDLTTKLAELRAKLQYGAAPQALAYSLAPSEIGTKLAGIGLGTRGFENTYQPGSPGFLASFLGGLGGNLLGGGGLGNKLFGGLF